jgi:hypothetical protein
MYSYALKRLTRGRGIFLALFLSVALAATLFSGILQASDSVGAFMLGKALDATDVDIVSSAENRNLTRTSLAEVEEAIGGLEHVGWVEHLIRSVELGPGEGMELYLPDVNVSFPFTFIAMASDSTLLQGLEGLDILEPGKIYLAGGSANASLFDEGEIVTAVVPTYVPGGSIIDIQKRSTNFTVGGVMEVDDRFFSIAFGRYADFLTSLLTGSGITGRRPVHKLAILSEESFLEWMQEIYGERRRHTRVLIAETIIGLEREEVVNPWDPEASWSRVDIVYERVNALGARFGYVPVNYLGELLNAIGGVSSQMRVNTLLVAAPVFFTAWYLGVTVSDISLGLRRREIGLLFTRGFTHRQAFYVFLFEAAIISLLAGVMGILLGAAILPLVLPGISLAQIFGSVSPITFVVSVIFSCALAIVAIYKPAKGAIEMDIVDALREYQPDEEEMDSWIEPALALLLGLYRVAMLVLGLTVEQFRPDAGNFIVFLLYSTWWGSDFLLSYIAPILIFWGFTKLFVQYFPWFHNAIGRIGGSLAGDISIFSTLSSRRNAGRAAAYAFMTALIIGYGVSVIGGITSTDDYTNRFAENTIGADASVWLFEGENTDTLKDRIGAVEGVAGATVETWLEAESIVGVIPVRVIDPLEWRNIAYLEEGWVEGDSVFEIMNDSNANAILARRAAEIADVAIGEPWLMGLGDKVHTFSVVGFFGSATGSGVIQNPTLYIPDTFTIKEKYVSLSRILVKLDEDADLTSVKNTIQAIDPDILGVDITEEIIETTSNNIFLAGPRRVEELGVYFAALVSSAGIVLIVSTTLRSRLKELTVMAIRGFSGGQLAVTLLVESLGTTLLSIGLGLVVGLVMLRGETQIFNAAISLMLEKRVVFPISAQLTLVVVVVLLILSTVIPILFMVRRVSENPTWRTQE